MNEAQATKYIREQMDAHGLTNWTIEWNNATSFAGMCQYRLKRLRFSRPYLAASMKEDAGADFYNTVTHEIAHALVGPGAGHGPVWKRKMLELGANPSRVTSVSADASAYKYNATCRSCARVYKRGRKTNSMSYLSCAKCNEGLDWVEVATGKIVAYHFASPEGKNQPLNIYKPKPVVSAAKRVSTPKPKVGGTGGRYSQGFTDIESLWED